MKCNIEATGCAFELLDVAQRRVERWRKQRGARRGAAAGWRANTDYHGRTSDRIFSFDAIIPKILDAQK